MWGSKVALHAIAFSENFVTMPLTSLVICDAPSLGHWLAAQYCEKAIDNLFGGSVFHLGQYDKTNDPTDECLPTPSIRSPDCGGASKLPARVLTRFADANNWRCRSSHGRKFAQNQ